MQAPSGQMTAPPVQDLLTAEALAGEWVLDPRKSSIRLRSGSMWAAHAGGGDEGGNR